jgi:hypothetical protein
MREKHCWNCGNIVPEGAIFCSHCEERVDDVATGEDAEDVRKILAEYPALEAEVMGLLEADVTGQEFVAALLVGDCASCGSANVDDCENDPIDDLTVGRCFDCDAIWCLECGELLTRESPVCPHWDVCDECDACDPDGQCPTPVWDCARIRSWKEQRERPGDTT